VYLLDSNIFIEAKNRYYAFDLAPVFWTWLDELCLEQTRTISLVKDELIDGDDELAEWMNERKSEPWILEVDDAATQQVFAQVADAVNNGSYKQAAKTHFLSKADPWLVAKGKVLEATVVTHERPNPFTGKKVPLPNICENFGVNYMDTFDFLRSQSKVFN